MSTTENQEPLVSQPPGRRGFIKKLTGGAAGVLAGLSVQVLGASPAAAAPGDGCCDLVFSSNYWCSYFCQFTSYTYRCWTCNGGQCHCCECTGGHNCYYGPFRCSRNFGAC